MWNRLNSPKRTLGEVISVGHCSKLGEPANASYKVVLLNEGNSIASQGLLIYTLNDWLQERVFCLISSRSIPGATETFVTDTSSPDGCETQIWPVPNSPISCW